MVVVYCNLCVKTIFLSCLVILVIELNVLYGRRLKVCNQGELKNVLLIFLKSAVAVVKVSHQLYGVFRIIGKVIIHSVKFNFHVCRIYTCAVAVRFTDVSVLTFKDNLACSVVGNSDYDLLRITEKSCPYETQGVNSTHLI